MSTWRSPSFANYISPIMSTCDSSHRFLLHHYVKLTLQFMSSCPMQTSHPPPPPIMSTRFLLCQPSSSDFLAFVNLYFLHVYYSTRPCRFPTHPPASHYVNLTPRRYYVNLIILVWRFLLCQVSYVCSLH